MWNSMGRKTGVTELDRAISELDSLQLSVLIRKGEQVVFTSREPMLRPLLKAIDQLGPALRGATVVDRIVGKAAALLCAYAGVGEVLTPLASEPAIDLLTARGIPVSARRIVPYIRNRDGTDMCPMERLALAYDDPGEFLAALKDRT